LLGSVRDELVAYMKKRRADLVFTKWQQAMLEPNRFQDRLSRQTSAEPAGDERDTEAMDSDESNRASDDERRIKDEPNGQPGGESE